MGGSWLERHDLLLDSLLPLAPKGKGSDNEDEDKTDKPS